MTETKSFSLPEEIASKIDRYAAATRLKASAIATLAFEDFLKKPEVAAIVDVPAPTELAPTAQS